MEEERGREGKEEEEEYERMREEEEGEGRRGRRRQGEGQRMREGGGKDILTSNTHAPVSGSYSMKLPPILAVDRFNLST